jgi:hypothetical protein
LVTTVIGVFLPVVHVNVGNTANQQLKFTFVKDVDEVLRDELVEA